MRVLTNTQVQECVCVRPVGGGWRPQPGVLLPVCSLGGNSLVLAPVSAASTRGTAGLLAGLLLLGGYGWGVTGGGLRVGVRPPRSSLVRSLICLPPNTEPIA